ncbi:MAG: flagellar hook-associated protein FlgL [Burkholderiaceae bacterium]|nr:flagellar hook-associated protein FlgL [Burkholderiaceae bacterium]
MSIYRVSTANSYDGTINRINQRTAELVATQEKLAAGKRVLKASDDPVAATLAERESNRLMRTEADLRALERSRSGLIQAESTIGQMGEVLARFKELLVQGGNPTLSASDRQSIAQEMRGLREQLLNLANTQDTEGNALLGGLGVTNVLGKPFADVYGANTGVVFQAVSGQAAATETALPNRVDGSFALMRVPTGDGYFEVEQVSGNVLVTGIAIRDMDALMATGFYADPPANVDFSVQVNWDGTQATLDVFRSDTALPIQSVPLGPASPGQTLNLRQALGAASIAVGDDTASPPIDYGFDIVLDGSVTFPAAVTSDPIARFDLKPSQTGDLFATLQRAIDALEADGNSTQLTQELGRVHQEMQAGLDRLLLVRGRLGELLRRADSIESQLQDRSVASQKELSNLTDLDLVKGISDFQTQQLGLQVALQSYAQVQRLTLFQYIA